MTSLSELVIAASEGPWRRIGLDINAGVAVTAGVRLRFASGDRGLVGWGFAGLPDPSVEAIDGVPTAAVESPELRPAGSLDVVAIDHVVVNTSDLERTSTAIEVATGAELRRVRQAGAMRQGFHRLGPVVVEVVERAEIDVDIAALWGFVWTVADLDSVCARLGPDVISPPRDAVQRGRRIATVRPSAGLGVPLALMDPR